MKVYLMNLEPIEYPAQVRVLLQAYFNRVVSHPDNHSSIRSIDVEYLSMRGVEIVKKEDLLVHFIESRNDSVVKAFIRELDPNAVVPPGAGATIRAFRQTFRMESNGFTVFGVPPGQPANAFQSCSEVYIGSVQGGAEISRWIAIANLAFHELMHAKCLLDDAGLHDSPGVALGRERINPPDRANEADIALMARNLGRRVRPWTGGRKAYFSDPGRALGVLRKSGFDNPPTMLGESVTSWA